MKFVIPTQEFNYLINKALNVVSPKATIPILSNILLEAADGQIRITATDLTVGVRCCSDVQVIEEGATTLPAKRLAQLLRELTVANVEVTTDANEITEIVAGASRFKLHGMGRADFPALPDLEGAMKLTLKESELADMFFRTSFAVSREDNRYVLTGVFLEVKEGRAIFTGTDGKRLAKAHLPISAESHIQGHFIVPLKAVEEINKNLSENSGDGAVLYLMTDKIAVQATDTLIITKLLSGDYPDVSRVIPEKPEAVVSLHREELMTLLRQVSLFTADSNHSVRFTFGDSELKLSANTMEVGEGVVKMAVNYDGPKLEVAFNPSFLLGILGRNKGETVNMGLIDAFNPAVITDSASTESGGKDPSPIFVLMPMRLGEE